MNKQLKKELKYFAIFLIVMSLCFYLYKRWDDSLSNTIIITSDVQAKEIESVSSPDPLGSNHFIKTKVSYYWPDLGGVNCLTFVNGECISKMANGRPWKEGINIGMACPPEMKMGTKLYFPDFDRTFTCMDRGSMIVKTESNEYWVDLLISKPLVPYGKVVEAEVL
jgi:hypothetical protein